MSDPYQEPLGHPRTLAGATILQIVPALREGPDARAALNVAFMLLQAGARALIAGREGPLVGELRAYGGEWIPMAADTANPFTRRRNVRTIENLIGTEGVDIVHAQCPSAAWSARRAAARIAVWLVTTLPDVPLTSSREFARRVGDLARGDHIIAPSNYAALPVMERFGIPPEQVTVILRAVDTGLFDPQTVTPGRLDDLRHAWRIPPHSRVVLTPGRVAPWNGQMLLPEVARALVDNGHRDIVFVVAGENQQHRGYAHAILAQAQAMGVDAMFRITGHCPDMPAVFAAADVVAVPAIEPPVLGSVVAQAQAMGKPVVMSDVGVLPEYVVVPPNMPEDLRTGWTALKGDPLDFARALDLALTLMRDRAAYLTMSERAREFARYMFSPDSGATAMRAVYMSLLAREL
jgi:glycosyltransferase involved in cell wall biosynthesis